MSEPLFTARDRYEREMQSKDPERAAKAMHDLGLWLKRRNLNDEARDYLQRSIDTGHSRVAPLAMNNLGLLLMQVGDFAEARANFERAAGAGDADQARFAWMNMATLSIEQGSREQARLDYLEALKFADDAPHDRSEIERVIQSSPSRNSEAPRSKPTVDRSHGRYGPPLSWPDEPQTRPAKPTAGTQERASEAQGRYGAPLSWPEEPPAKSAKSSKPAKPVVATPPAKTRSGGKAGGNIAAVLVIVGILVISFLSFLASRDSANSPDFQVGECVTVAGGTPDFVGAKNSKIQSSACSGAGDNYRVMKAIRGDSGDNCNDFPGSAYYSERSSDGWYALCLTH